jgi:uncharacterized protein (DUF2147 family)
MGMARANGIGVLAIAAIGFLAAKPAPAIASPVDGSWVIQDLILDIFNCQQAVCGKIAWTKDPQRRRTDCGRTIVWGLSPSGPETWSGGSIYDPTDGNTYRLSATLQPDGTLHARIYRGAPLLGKTEILRKVPTRSLDGWCS